MKNTTCMTQALLIGGAISLLGGCSRQEATYEDCLLQNGQHAKSSEALSTVKLACKGKFPKTFDFDDVANKAEVAKWAIVASKPGFGALDEAAKSAAREQYFENVIRPRVQPDYTEDARVQFDAFSRRTERAVPTLSPASSPESVPVK